jgi:uncharacterized protein YodC (DUF2158 family)
MSDFTILVVTSPAPAPALSCISLFLFEKVVIGYSVQSKPNMLLVTLSDIREVFVMRGSKVHISWDSVWVGNLVRPLSGGPIMFVDLIFQSPTMEVPDLICEWTENGEPRRGNFRGDMMEPVFPDGSSRNCSKQAYVANQRNGHTFRAGNLVRHLSGGPIMMIDGVYQHRWFDVPTLSCVWVEDGERRASRFTGDLVQTVFADGSPRDYSKEDNTWDAELARVR